MKIIRLKILYIGVAILFLSGCATTYNPATGRDEVILIDSATEVSIGESVVADINKKRLESTDKNLQDRARRIGRRVAELSDRKDIDYKFSVLNDKELNAVTLPGGFIYVNRGLMEKLNDDEFAYVLSHEVGHVAARHIVKKIQANMAYQLILSLGLAGAGQGAGASAQNIAQGVNAVYNLAALSYSRQDEYEADRLGAKYSYKAGFNPYAAISALEKLKAQESQDLKILQYFRTHPYVDDRISALKTVIPQIIDSKI